MKIRYILIIAVFLFSMNVPIQAQSDEGGFLEGIQSSLSNMFDNSIQHTEAGRLYMLFTSDIRMLMGAHNKEKEKTIAWYVDPIPGSTAMDYIKFEESSNDASIYAEFDWDNKALSMHLKETENDQTISWSLPIINSGNHKKENDAIDHYQFTDKDGFWYVPFEHPSYPGEQNYVKINAKRAAQAGLEGLSELDLESLADEWFLQISALANVMYREFLTLDNAEQLDNIYNTSLRFGLTAILDAQSLRNELRNILNDEYMEVVGFPVFIHWALLYSPNLIRSKFNVTETTYNCYGIPNGCTKLTIASGRERGKYMIFDQYNRLIYIDSKEEGSVMFAYDRDVTVNLPPAYNLSDLAVPGNVIFNRD